MIKEYRRTSSCFILAGLSCDILLSKSCTPVFLSVSTLLHSGQIRPIWAKLWNLLKLLHTVLMQSWLERYIKKTLLNNLWKKISISTKGWKSNHWCYNIKFQTCSRCFGYSYIENKTRSENSMLLQRKDVQIGKKSWGHDEKVMFSNPD